MYLLLLAEWTVGNHSYLILSYVVLPAERTESPIVTTDLRIYECMKTQKLPGYSTKMAFILRTN